jgi:citrate lyase subunit beta / citryl-CoA lyase
MSARIPRSWLFAPGDQPAKMAKAFGSGAGAVILDLEDSVAETNKAAARTATAEFLAARASEGPQLWVRINPLSTAHALADIAAVAPAGPDGIVLPKADGAHDVVKLGHDLRRIEAETGLVEGQIHILAIATETPASIFSLGGYGVVGPRLLGLTWGAEDLPAAVGAQFGRHPDGQYTDLCRIARSLCIAGAAAADVVAIDTVYPNFKDPDGLRTQAELGRREGFVGMMAIHPAQVEVIEQVYRPSDAEIAHARRVVDLFAANPGAGVLALDGKMLDRPHLKQAERLLAGL